MPPARPLLPLLLTALLGSPAPTTAQLLLPDLTSHLEPLRGWVYEQFRPVATRLLSVREGVAYLEPVPGIRADDRLLIYPPGTIVIGPRAANPLPEPLGAVRIRNLASNPLTAEIESAASEIPAFAPVLKSFAGHRLALVLAIDPAHQERAAQLDLVRTLYRVLFESSSLPLTSVLPERWANEVVPAHEALIQEPATDILRVRFDGFTLELDWESLDSGYTQATLQIALPDDRSRDEPLFSIQPGVKLPQVQEGGNPHWQLSAELWDCKWAPEGLAQGELWCLTDTGIVSLRVTNEVLAAQRVIPVDWEQGLPVRRNAYGRLAWVHEPAEGWVLYADRGSGGPGVRGVFTQGRLVLSPAPAGIPLADSDSGSLTRLPQEAQRVSRFAKAAIPAAPAGLPEGWRDVARWRDHWIVIDTQGMLALYSPEGTRLYQWPGTWSGPIGIFSDALFAATPGRRIAALGPLRAPGSVPIRLSPVLPMPPVALAGPGAEEPFWIAGHDANASPALFQLLPPAQWKEQQPEGAALWPQQSTTLRLGLPVEHLDLTPDGAVSPLEIQLVSALYDTPLRPAGQGMARPHAVRQVYRVPHTTNFDLELAPGLRWWDGSPVTPQQVVAGWEQTRKAHPLGAPAFAGIAPGGFTVTSQGRIRIALIRQEDQFLQRLTDPQWSLVRGNRRTLTGSGPSVVHRQGTGPYQPVQLLGTTLQLRRHSAHTGGIPWTGRWDWELLGSAGNVRRAYLAGRLDAAVPALTQSSFFLNPDWHTHWQESPGQGTIGLLINPQSAALGQDKARRQALLRLPDAERLRRVTLGGLADPCPAHFSSSGPAGQERLPWSSIPRNLVLAVPRESGDLIAIAERLQAEIPATDARWSLTLKPLPWRSLLQRRSDWDLAVWYLAGPPLPHAAEWEQFDTLWRTWGKVARTSPTPALGEHDLIQGGWWTPLARPRMIWLRHPAVRGWPGLHPARPDWADVWRSQ